MKAVSIRRLALVVLIGCLVAAGAVGQAPTSTSAPLPAQLEYKSVAFTARRIEPGDPRFRIAPEGFPFDGGVRLVSRDPALNSIAWINGLSSGMLRNGRAFALLPHFLARERLTEMRVARTIELAGGFPDRIGDINPLPASPPDIPGYRFVVSDSVIPPHAVGLWQRIRGPDETLIVSFHAASRDRPAFHQVVGRLPLRLNSIYLFDGLHTWRINVISEARVGRPIYILSYSLIPARVRLDARPEDTAPR
jgi:hypothetical protein